MASLATVSQGQHRADYSVVYPTWDRQKRSLSAWSDYRSDDTENGILSVKNDYIIDGEPSFQSHNNNAESLFNSNINNNVNINKKNVEITDDFEVYLDDPQNFYQEGFLEKLSQLRMAHKKTLESWQKLYEENVMRYLEKDEKRPVKLTSPSSCFQYPVHKVDIEYNEEEPIENIHCGPKVPVDTYGNFSRKNPVSQRPKAEGSTKNKTVRKNIESKSRLKDSNFSQQLCYGHQSFEKDFCQEFMTPTRSVQDEPIVSNSCSTNNIKAGFSDKSSLDHFSGVYTELSDIYGNNEDGVDANNYDDDDDSWHHRLTIPKPFNMTKREEINRTKKKSRTLLEYEKECEDKRKIEEEECRKMFKATPVPDHVYMPLYEEIRKKDEVRRSLVKEQTKEFLRSQEKPFSFTRTHWDDEKEEVEEQYDDDDDDDDDEGLSEEIQETEKKSNTFKANPIPRYILDSSIDEKLKDDANLREVKRRIRSFELLRSSSIPKGMEFRQKLMEQKLKSKSREMEKKKKKKHNPAIHYALPDYEALYKEFQKDLMKKRKVIESTNVQPFTFRTSELVKQRKKKKGWEEELQYDSEAGFGRLRRSNSFPDHLHMIPAKTTTTTQLRTQANREKITKQKINATKTENIPKSKDNNFLKKEIQLKMSASNQKSKNTKSTPKYREQQKNYSRQLQEMHERLEKRPLLFEQVEKNNIKNRVEKRFKETLRNFGLDESFVSEELFSPQNRRPSFPRPRLADPCYQENNDVETSSEKQDKTKDSPGKLSNNRDSFQNPSSKSSHCDDNSLHPSDCSSEETDNGQESARSEF